MHWYSAMERWPVCGTTTIPFLGGVGIALHRAGPQSGAWLQLPSSQVTGSPGRCSSCCSAQLMASSSPWPSLAPSCSCVVPCCSRGTRQGARQRGVGTLHSPVSVQTACCFSPSNFMPSWHLKVITALRLVLLPSNQPLGKSPLLGQPQLISTHSGWPPDHSRSESQVLVWLGG